MRACPCGCTRSCRIGLSRAVRLFEQLDSSLDALRPVITETRRECCSHTDQRTAMCQTYRHGELVRSWLIVHLHERATPGATPQFAEVARAASGLIATLSAMTGTSADRRHPA